MKTKIREAYKTMIVALVVGVVFWALPVFSQGFGGGKGGSFGGFGGGKGGFGGGRGGGGGKFGRFNSAMMSRLNNTNGSNLIQDLTEIEDTADPTMLGKQYGQVKGKVIDEEGKPVKGIEILIQRQDASGDFKAKSEGNGAYSYIGLPAGEYVMAIVYKNATGLWREVTLKNGHVVECDFDLKYFEAMGTVDIFGKLKSGKAVDKTDTAGNQDLTYPDQYKDRYKKAMDLAEKGEYAEAKKIFKELVDEKGDNEAFRYRLGQVHGYLKEYPDSIAQFKEAMNLNEKAAKKDGGYPMLISYTLLFLDKFEESEAMAAKAAEWRASAGAESYYNIGMALTDKGDAPKAEAAFRKATELDGGNAHAQYQLGITLLSTHPNDLPLAKKPLQAFVNMGGEKDEANATPEEKQKHLDDLDSAKQILKLIDQTAKK